MDSKMKLRQLFITHKIIKNMEEINGLSKKVIYSGETEEGLQLLKEDILKEYPYNPYFTECIIQKQDINNIYRHGWKLVYTGSTSSD